MTIAEAQNLMNKFVDLKNKAQLTKTNEDIKALRSYEKKCVERFRYLVTMKVGKYKSFSNYEDLIQDGMEALITAMHKYDPNKGIFFWLAHKYIDTRISRCANLHTTIRFPLKYAKAVVPHRESVLPIMIDHNADQHKLLESHELKKIIYSNLNHLSNEQRQMVQMLFGMDGEAPHSIAKICKRFKIPRSYCIKMLNNIFDTLKNNIQL